jgi:hypothetical protein
MNPGRTLLLTGMIGGLLSGVPSGADVIALYEFNSGRGDQVVDRSGLEPPLNLRITQPERVRWVSDGLELKAATIVRSDGPAGKINRAVARTGELTVEAWIKPADTDQKGPARIVTISKNSSFRNATLGQEGRRYDFRLRARRTSDNGIPSVDSPGGEVAVKWTQVLYARDRHGNATLYVDGRPVGWGPVVGDLQGWAEGYQLALGNELTVDRPWRGVFRRVVIHDRALPPEEVRRSFGSGPLGAGGLVAESRSHPGVRLF